MQSIEEILVKYFQGTCSEEEKSRVEQFRAEQPQEFDLMEKLWQKRQQIQVQHFDPQQAWQKVHRQIKPNPKSKVRELYFRYGVAASLLFILSVSAWFWYQSAINPPNFISATHQASPIQLEDGTKVWLNKGAYLRYPPSFTSSKRMVYLSGEAFFEVARDTLHPFIVQAQGTTVKVLGTSFNVQSQDAQTQVSVATGRVEVSTKQGKEAVRLSPGYTAQVIREEIQVTPASLNFQAWRTGKFIFQDRPLPEVIQELNSYYDHKLRLLNNPSDCRLTISFDRENLAQVKEAIALICNVNFQSL